MPGRTFQPHISEILKFCRRSDGGRQYEEIEAALDRLKNTTLKVVRTKKGRGGRALRVAEAEGLLSNYKTTSYADNGRVQMVEIEIPNWIYREVVEAGNPDVLTMHPDFFLLEGGLERFVYRLARRAAGKTEARWTFATIYERSGSAGTFKEFSRLLRGIIEGNNLPEYALVEIAGQDGPVLVMTHRNAGSPMVPAEATGV
jgi:plasmid replication initiation protein